MKRLVLLLASMVMSAALYGAEKTIIVGVEELNYYPYYDFSEGNKRGFFKELLDRFAAENGYTVVYKPLPVKRLYNELLVSGQIDFKFPDNPLWGSTYKEGKAVIYSEEVAAYIDGTMVAEAHEGEGVEKIRKIGTIAGFSPWVYMDSIKNKQVESIENRTLPGLLKTTLAGRVDGAYVNIAVAEYILLEKLKKPGALVWDKKLPYDKNNYRLATLRHPETIREFNRFLKEKSLWINALKKTYKISEE